jgi:TolA-binding protein
MGDTYLRLGNWPRALHFLNTGYTIYPRDPVAPLMLVRMADGLRLGGRIQQAKTLYQTVVERHPETEGELSALLGLAELADKEAVGAADEAEVQNAYGAILKRWSANPRAAEALLHLAQSYQRAGSVQEAAAAYDELLRRGDSGPWRAQARQGLERTLQGLSAAGNIVEVANLFLQHRALLTVPAVDGRTGLLVAGALTQLGLIDSAITLLRASLSAGVPKAQQEYGLKALADAYRKKGDLIHLEQSWKEYLRKFPQGAWRGDARVGLLIGLSRPGQQKEAEKTCQTYLHEKAAIGSNEVANQELVLLCADRLAQDGRLEAAQPLYREILKKEPTSAQGLWAAYQIARASQAANRSAEAMDYFARVSKTDKDSLLAAAASAHLAAPMASKSR